MDNHPIPQDVTGFQFRLIGDMTVKQFAYVAVGGIFVVVFLYAPIHIVFRVVLMILSGGIGLALAFMPLEGRPLDVMAGYFLRALFMPNQYAYHKVGGTLRAFGYQTKPVLPSPPTTQSSLQMNSSTMSSAKTLAREQKLQGYLQTLHSQNLSPLEKRELEFTQKLFPQPVPEKQKAGILPNLHVNVGGILQHNTNIPPVAQHGSVPPALEQPQKSDSPAPVPPPQESEKKPEPAPDEKNKTLSLQENVLSQELNHAKQEEQTETDAVKKQEAHIHVTDLELQLQQIQAQKEALEKQLHALRAQVSQSVAPVQQQPPTPPTPDLSQPQTQSIPQAAQNQPVVPAPEQPKEQQAAVRKIPADLAKSIGLPHIPDVPNLIVGIVKDPRGNVLSNILVEVKDKDGTPARAFRTNQLGQFASATQLSPGTYEIQFEDPKGVHLFDTIQINATNEILMPIEVISHDEREELRKALFN